MAIYHFDAQIVSRARGMSVVAGAAYRAGEALKDDRYAMTHDYTRKHGVAHAEILAPIDAPEWVFDREVLWNRVETGEKRKDAQLAREIELALPIELSHAESVALMRDFIHREFVSKGMIADFAIHRDNPANPHAHILLTMREVTGHGFGPKIRSWNAKAKLLQWRASWAEVANEHLTQAGFDIRIDHRTLEAQKIELTPGRKIGIGKERHEEKTLPRYVAERIAENERIAKENGNTILSDPTVALHALTHQRSTFTHRDIAKFLHTRTSGADQFDAALLKVTASPELVPLGKDEWNQTRYTTRDMLEAEKSLLNRSLLMTHRRGHGVTNLDDRSLQMVGTLSGEQRTALNHVIAAGDIKAVVGVAGSGKSTLLAAARHAWESAGLTVKGATLSGIAADNLERASGIKSRTLASFEYGWMEGRDPLTSNDVLVIDEAGMVGTKQLERLLAAADKARAKVVLLGDPEQLQAIEAGAAFRGITEQIGAVELTQVRRQHQEWAREATHALASGKTIEALATYEQHGAIIALDTKAEARAHLLTAWAEDGNSPARESRLILAYTRDDVRELNDRAREILRANGQIGSSQILQTTRGDREFADNDRIMFLRNEKSLGVKNGSLGTIESIDHGVLQVRLDGHGDTPISVDIRDYQDLDHGYASTVHKSQGSTVDRTYVLASRYFDRHTSYVALSRHRETALLFYGRDEFAASAEAGVSDHAAAREKFQSSLARARPKELAHDFLERDPAGSTLVVAATQVEGGVYPQSASVAVTPSLAERFQRGFERGRARFAGTPSSGKHADTTFPEESTPAERFARAAERARAEMIANAEKQRAEQIRVETETQEQARSEAQRRRELDNDKDFSR